MSQILLPLDSEPNRARASNQLIRRFLEHNMAGVLRNTLEGRIVETNNAMARMLGFDSVDELKRHRMEEFFVNPLQRKEMIERLLSGQPAVDQELMFQRRDGEQLYVRVHAGLQPDLDGINRLIVGTVVDITERKKTEEALRVSERRYRRFVEHNLAGVLRNTLDGQILEVNAVLVRLLGYDSAEEMKTHRTKEFYLDPADRDVLLRDLKSAREVSGRELAFKRKDGGRVDLLVNAVLLPPENGTDEIMEGTLVDITERKRVEAALLASQAQLAQLQKMDAIGRLAGGIAHDFNNALAVIGGYSELVLKALPADSPITSDVREIAEAAAHAAGLTRRLLTFGRKQILNPLPCDLNTIVHSMEKMLHRLLSEDIVLRSTLTTELPPVQVDPQQIEQVIMNLVINARDAMPAGGQLDIITGHAVAELPARGDHPAGLQACVLLSVQDTGVGMDELTRGRIFEPFFTTKDVGKGNGLGLATVYGIVTQLGGNIEIQSEPGAGTTMSIYLPLSDAPVPDPSPAPAAPATPLAPVQRSITVLIAEDADTLRVLAAKTLRDAGYRVLVAQDGEGAFQLAMDYRHDIQVLITDMLMPNMGGMELAWRLSAIRPDLRVIFMTGYSPELIDPGHTLPKNAVVLTKPFSLNLLLERVRESVP